MATVLSTLGRRTAPGLIALAILALACGEPRSTEPDTAGPAFAKAPSGPTVTTAVPDNAPQDTTLDVRVLGTGFDQGSQVDLALAGIPDPVNVRTNSTHFVKSTELVANITISPTANLARYDVVVRTSTGKKGIGTERFLIRAYNDIGTLGGTYAWGRAVNSTGTIVGSSLDPSGVTRPFVWRVTDGMRALPTLVPSASGTSYGINGAQVIVGVSRSAPVRWVPTGSGSWRVEELVNTVGQTGIAFDINTSGLIVGNGNLSGPARAFRWTEAGGMVGLPVLPGGTANSALAVNDAGTAVGWATTASDVQLGVAWPASGGVVQLPLCSGATSTWAEDLNDAGVIVGRCIKAGSHDSGKRRNDDSVFAVRWFPDPAAPDAWLPPEVLSGSSGCAAIIPWAINNAGEVVGSRCAQPFVWDEAHGFRILPVYAPNGSGGGEGINDPEPGAPFLIAGQMQVPNATRAVWWPHP